MLLADCHEPKEIIEKLKVSLKTKTLKLKYADYSFSDTAIERKTLSDFFSSLKNARLHSQMEDISRFYSERYLLIEGFFDFSYVNNISYLYNQLSLIVLNFDAKIIFSKDYDSTADIIKKIYQAKYLHYNKGTGHDKFDKARSMENFLGISKEKLKLLFCRFGSIRNIAGADKNQFKGIKGIGSKTYKKIENALDENVFEI